MAKEKFMIKVPLIEDTSLFAMLSAEESELMEKIDAVSVALCNMLIGGIPIEELSYYKVKEYVDENNEVKMVLEKMGTKKLECLKQQMEDLANLTKTRYT